MDIFAALADPVRRSLLAELVDDAGAVTVEDRGRERYYALDPAALGPVVTYVAGLVARPVPEQALDALETEVRRTTRERRRTA